jgi:type II secretory pathway pseudopilin PulG
MIRTLFLVMLSTVFVLSGCNTMGTKQTQVEPLVHKARLNEKLPENAYAYLRLPNTWSFFSAANDSFASAQGNEAHNAQVKQLQSALNSVLEQELPANIKPALDLLVSHLESPLELMVYPLEGAGTPYLLATADLSYDNAEQLNPLLDEMVELVPGIEIAQFFDDSGYAMLQTGLAYIVMYYDEKQSLVIFSGLGVSQSLLEEQLATLADSTDANSEFLAFEKQVDSSGVGAMMWLNTASVIPMATAFAPAQAQQFIDLGLTDVSSIAIGMGSANGKGRLRMAVNVSESSKLFAGTPTHNSQPDFKTVGQPKLVSHIRMLNQEQYIANAELIQKQGYSDVENQLEELKQYGLEPLKYLDNYGHLILFKDDLGFFVAQHIRNKDTYADYISEQLKNFQALADEPGIEADLFDPFDAQSIGEWFKGIRLDSRIFEGQNIYHLQLPSMMSSVEDMSFKDDMPEALLEFIAGGRNHIYWIIEDDYIVYASLPQLLMERIKHKKTDSIEQWQAARGLSLNDSLLSVSGQFDGGKANLYHDYLQFLTLLADSLNAEFDIFAFPTASELSMDDPGVASIQLDVSHTSLALELTYEKTPFDALIMADTGGAVTLVMIGILSAVAIPAYNDYRLRAEVANIYNESGHIRNDLEEYYAVNGVYPDESAIAALDTTMNSENVYSVEVEPDTGVIAINLFNDSHLEDEIIWFSPAEDWDGSLYYACESTLSNKYLPSACRY